MILLLCKYAIPSQICKAIDNRVGLSSFPDVTSSFNVPWLQYSVWSARGLSNTASAQKTKEERERKIQIFKYSHTHDNAERIRHHAVQPNDVFVVEPPARDVSIR
jgi:hypothetical protein